ncbi:zinc ABC transporter substrate-binding protein ZnuA [Thiorhodospira sibirica]|uniref:zinc ABC transporter substrate-binding protein ZnuA n=1 Tax=Thiorhodospira sibirica TaxID=154347 RepID=UPI00022C0AD9|nr:zinc ABC transporter substrate-binding protein ZnuA [Thiorhodospira sibirica]
MSVKRICVFLILFGWLPSSLLAAPNVVVSINPIHALVSGVMEGVAEPLRLVPPGTSPHDYAMRPSEMRALQDADLVIWVGPELERFLQRPLHNLPAQVQRLTLLKDAELRLLPMREGGIWDAHEHGHDHDHNHRHDHHHHGHHHHDDDHLDTHIWLSPYNAQRIVEAVSTQLIALDPHHADQYRQNRDALLSGLQALDTRLQQRLATVKERPFIVFHDAYQYFEQHYGLTPAGSITVDPSQPPGARRLREIRTRIQQADAICVFSEPQFRPALVRTLIEGTSARTGVLDPLGIDLAQGAQGYMQLLEQLADAVYRCLSDTQKPLDPSSP